MKTFQTTATVDEQGRIHVDVPDAQPGETVELVGRIAAPPDRPHPDQHLPRRQFGSMKGQIHVYGEFDAPLPPEIQSYFDGEGED